MKRLLLSFSILVLLVTAFSACNNETEKTAAPAFNLDSAKAAIAASNKVYGECFSTGDSTKFVNCYTADGCIYPPNTPRMCGPQTITAFFNGAYKMGIRNLKLTTDEVVGNETYVSEVGKYELMGDKNMSMDKGKFIVIWKNDNGKWKMYRDVWNSDMPPPPTAK